MKQLLIHNTDTAVKPIIGNTEIEKVAELTYNKEALEFEIWSPEKVKENIEEPDLPIINNLYDAISHSSSVT